MPDLRDLPLDQLLLYCTPPLPSELPQREAAWCELQRRVLAGNEAAWDALVSALWDNVLTWLYARVPNLAPASAERLTQLVLLTLRSRYLYEGGRVVGLMPTVMLSRYLQQQIDEQLVGGGQYYLSVVDSGQ